MKKRSSPPLFLVFFCLFWTLIVGFFDYMLVKQVVGQVQSTNFPSVTGHIIHSELTRSTGSKGGTTYGVDIRYRYQIGDQSFESKRYRTTDWTTSDSAWARAAVAKHSVGSEATIFYNPTNPKQALLLPGLDGSDLMLALFLTPFNVVMLGLWSLVFGQLNTNARAVAGGVDIIPDGRLTRIRLPRWSAMAAGMVSVGAVAFVSIFLLAFTTGFHPSLMIAGEALIAAYGAGAFVYAWQRQNILLGKDDLIIDEAARTLELPLTFGRKNRVTIDFSDISAVSVKTLIHTSDNGNNTTYTYAPLLHLHSRESENEQLAEWSDSDKAESFADWLRQQYGWPAGVCSSSIDQE